MRMVKGLTLVGAIAALALATQGSAGAGTNVYTVGVLGVPGVDTGLAVQNGMGVTVTATGVFCPGTGTCYGPDGTMSVDTTKSSYGGYVLPGAPAYGLIGQLGDGPWVQIGSGPTTLCGTGDLRFAVNDDLWPDNSGSFTVTVSDSSSAWPGNGYGDVKHGHTGPPPHQGSTGCWPGNGYGDPNHDHGGPPGQSNGQPSATPSAGHSNAGGHGKR